MTTLHVPDVVILEAKVSRIFSCVEVSIVTNRLESLPSVHPRMRVRPCTDRPSFVLVSLLPRAFRSCAGTQVHHFRVKLAIWPTWGHIGPYAALATGHSLWNFVFISDAISDVDIDGA